MKEWCKWIADQRTFPPEASLLSGGPVCQLKSKKSQEGEKHNWISKQFVSIDQWGQATQLIIYEAKTGNLEGFGLL